MTGRPWNRQQTTYPGLVDLTYVFRFNVVIQETRVNAATAIGVSIADIGTSLTYWPGRKFSVNTAQGQALLGSPNGGGVAWLLAQHKAALGNRAVTDVTVFRTQVSDDQKDAYLNLCYHIAIVSGEIPPQPAGADLGSLDCTPPGGGDPSSNDYIGGSELECRVDTDVETEDSKAKL